MAADEARVGRRRARHARLRRADVRDGAPSPLAASTAATCAGSCATGAATTASSAPATASSSEPPASTAPRSPADCERVAGPGPSRATLRHAGALRGEADRGADQPGADDREPRHDQSSATPRASARRRGTRGRATAARSGAGRRASCSARRAAPRARASEPPRHSVTSSPVNSRWTPPGHVRSCAAGGEEALDLGHDRVEVARLAAGRGRERVRVHRVAHPDDRMPGLAHGAQERRQQLADALGAHARDQRQPAGDPLAG